jgi:hypothetical protein
MGHPPQIPLTPQTNELNFPRHDPKAAPGHSGHPYPKMLTRPFTKEDREVWLQRNMQTDPTTRQHYYNERVPKLGDPIPLTATQELVDAGLANRVGEDVIADDEGDEKLIYQTLGIEPPSAAPGKISIPMASEREAELQAENVKLRKLLLEQEDEAESAQQEKAMAEHGKSTAMRQGVKRRAIKRRRKRRPAAPALQTQAQD